MTTKKDENKEEQPASFVVSMQDAPPNSIPESAVEEPSVLDSVLSRLGIKKEEKKDGKEAKPKPLLASKLNKVQEQAVELLTPLGGTIVIFSMSWVWARLGEEYRILAPSKETAQDIAAPLVRIYVRHNKSMAGAVSPDTADILSCVNALVLYIHASLTLFEQINKEKEAFTHDTNGNNNRQGKAQTPSASARHIPVQQPVHEDAGELTTSGSAIPPGHLSERERQNFMRLSELRERDIAARARRSGVNGNVQQ